jgi:NADPH:quinone reductase-like Zn-dependent oxidoreductase
VAVGDDVKDWKTGDRVCANFSLEHIDGDPTPKTKNSGLGAPIDGVLREYLAVPGYVSYIFCASPIRAIS